MTLSTKNELLRQLPSVSDLLQTAKAGSWLAEHPRSLVTHCLRLALENLRAQVRSDGQGRCGVQHVGQEYVLEQAGLLLTQATQPRLRSAINATGIVLHTGLGRAVWPAGVVDSMTEDLKGYVTLAVDCESGERLNRDKCVEPALCELTGAQAATVVNNNAAATILVLAALAAGRRVIISRGQLVEIGGEFRLPDVMALSGAVMVEVGTTNRTHLRDYAEAVTPDTAAILRVHPSNYRVVGFQAEVPVGELAGLGRERNILVVDDLGAGALVDLAEFGLPHEPMVSESIAAGADIVLFSADKLIGSSQGGIIVGRKDLIERIRKHPLARAMRAGKSALMALERTLPLFRDLQLLKREHPLYRMVSTPREVLEQRAERLREALAQAAPGARVDVAQGVGYLGSGSLPMHEMPTWTVRLVQPGVDCRELARRWRVDKACVFTRLAEERVVLDVRTITDEQVGAIAGALVRVLA